MLTPALLHDAKLIEQWALEMQATIDCYEETKNAPTKENGK